MMDNALVMQVEHLVQKIQIVSDEAEDVRMIIFAKKAVQTIEIAIGILIHLAKWAI